MLFNSLHFAIFLPIVFLLYWGVTGERLKIQNAILLIASLYFYGAWDFRFLFLLTFSIFLDYYTGIKIYQSKEISKKKFWLWLSIIINLGFLGLFKYYNFFVESLSDALVLAGIKLNTSTLNVILPIGISFYTFHGLSYIIDIYKGRIEPEKNFIDYSLFVSFFPLLVAGPIERATHLLPQIKKERVFNYPLAVDGLKQILWGLFKKIVIADNCAIYADEIFNNSESLSGSTLLLGALFFTIQIYGDFSGYSDIALGTARLFGFDLLRNFAFPYFSRDIAEFWRRWHISLSTWFRDYLYIPLGGSKGGNWMRVRNTFIIFIVSGFWHGANWTFIGWGFLNALFIIPSILKKTNRTNLNIVAQGKILPSPREFFQMAMTFSLTVFAWIFFRAENISHAFSIISEIISTSLFQLPYFPEIGSTGPLFILTIFFFLVEWVGREHQHALQAFKHPDRKVARWAFYYIIFFITIFYASSASEKQFIYFQF
ncbi:MBOAT family protein [Flavihumibacter sp. ZG627]|uniref:MBOAT family O-acyltransferase n=1 Tax=Flavihumibacter sp. ZG627 TaxID=1463156 RepID=UPI00057F3D98|nr:MBOAT family O-acyltransferase [Flavihumibacter sp. ZG627]KIC92254.1 acyltransferase [Flavihumibacter sp. ZG627]